MTDVTSRVPLGHDAMVEIEGQKAAITPAAGLPVPT